MGGSRSCIAENPGAAVLEITRQVVFRNYKLRRFDTPTAPSPVSVRVEYHSHSERDQEESQCRR